MKLPGFLKRFRKSAAPKGERDLVLRSNLFDEVYYRESHGDVLQSSGLEPVDHYLKFGHKKGFNPSLFFDGSEYLSQNPDVKNVELNPLFHYLKWGRAEGRSLPPVVKSAKPPKAPTQQQWDALAAAKRDLPSGLKIDVIIPVFRGFDETANCLYTALKTRVHGLLPYEVVVVDDASPVPQLVDLLGHLHDLGLIRLLRNKTNLGFVKSVNEGMRLNTDRDVILLNSDTEVYGDWVDRLHRAAYSREDIGTVTPFSNNATICGYPNFPGPFNGAFEVGFAKIDHLAKSANAGQTFEIPTAVGFCMFIKRDCLREAHYFDEVAFGIGYCEENDFSLRIIRLGWRNVLAADVFVRHLGRVSFLGSSGQRIAQGLQIIANRYRHYADSVTAFVKRDPLKQARLNIDLARLRKATGDNVMLFVLHRVGGGTLRHVREMTDRLTAEGKGVLWLQPGPHSGADVELIHPDVKNLSGNFNIDLRFGLEKSAALLRDIGVKHIHVHHTLGFSPVITDWIHGMAEQCGIAYDVTIHDFFLACPRVHMVDEHGRYCKNVNVEQCEACVSTLGSPIGTDVSIWHWRAQNLRFLNQARRIYTPDVTAKMHLSAFFPDLAIEVRKHPEHVIAQIPAPTLRDPGETLRVAVLGALGPHKGSLVLQQCAEDALRRGLPIEFNLLGYSDRKSLVGLPNVRMTGAYSPKNLSQFLARRQCHMAFFPATWPETYSYTLTEAWNAGLYPVAFDIGAIAQRIREEGWGHILPRELFLTPEKVNDALLAIEPLPFPASFKPADPGSGNLWTGYYDLEEAKGSKARARQRDPQATANIVSISRRPAS